MNRITASIFTVIALVISFIPQVAFAAAGIFPSGGGNVQNGQTFTVTVKASGATFDSLQGTISISGPISIVSFSAGGATWLPGKSPANNNQFVGIVSPTSNLTVATIKLKGTKEGSGSVKVTGVRLARSGSEVGSSGGSTSFTITRAPTPPGGVVISSSTHPNPEETYEARTAEFTWVPPANGAAGYSYTLDQTADTTPKEELKSTAASAKFENLTIGTHYFHVRANNKDGWGPASHFRINIKAAIDKTLEKPTITEILPSSDFKNDIAAGTLTGLLIKGTGPATFTVNLVFTPSFGLPDGKYTAPIVDETGKWELAINDPVKAGFYQLLVQAQKESVVSEFSETKIFELSVADGGSIKLIEADDETNVHKQKQQEEAVKVAQAKSKQRIFLSGSAAAVIAGLILLFILYRRRLLSRLK